MMLERSHCDTPTQYSKTKPLQDPFAIKPQMLPVSFIFFFPFLRNPALAPKKYESRNPDSCSSFSCSSFSS